MREWKDALLANGLSAKTINGSYLAHVRTLYRLAKNDDLIDFDPTEGLRVREKKKAGKSRLPYLDEEVANIGARQLRNQTSLTLGAVASALTGSRVGEITQLWAKHVKYADGVHFPASRRLMMAGRSKRQRVPNATCLFTLRSLSEASSRLWRAWPVPSGATTVAVW